MSGSSGSSGSSGGSTSSLAMQFDAHQMLKVPHEQLAQATRKRQKMVEKELAEVKEVIKATVESENDPGPTISGLVERLRGLKRKLEEGRAQEDELLQRCRMRFDYLQAADESEGSKKERLQRLIADYLLRQGHDDAARQLAQEAGIEPYLDFDLVLASRGVLASLRAKDCEPALAWCAEHRAKLKKAGSTLELQLRLQQFVELVRSPPISPRARPSPRRHGCPQRDTGGRWGWWGRAARRSREGRRGRGQRTKAASRSCASRCGPAARSRRSSTRAST